MAQLWGRAHEEWGPRVRVGREYNFRGGTVKVPDSWCPAPCQRHGLMCVDKCVAYSGTSRETMVRTTTQIHSKGLRIILSGPIRVQDQYNELVVSEIACGSYGAFTRAPRRYGMKPAHAWDVDPQTISELKANLGPDHDVAQCVDAKDMSHWYLLEDSIVLTFCTPCQGWSGGLKLGTSGSRDILLAALRMVFVVCPLYAIFDLVPGAYQQKQIMTQWAARAKQGQYVMFLDKVQARDFMPQERARGMVFMIREDVYNARYRPEVVNAALAVAPRHMPTFDSEGTFCREHLIDRSTMCQLVLPDPLAKEYGVRERNHTWPRGMITRLPTKLAATLMEQYQHADKFRPPWYGTLREVEEPSDDNPRGTVRFYSPEEMANIQSLPADTVLPQPMGRGVTTTGRALAGTIALRALMLPKVLENRDTRRSPALAAMQVAQVVAQSIQDARPPQCSSPPVLCFHPMFGDHTAMARQDPVRSWFPRQCLQVLPRREQLVSEQRQWFMNRNWQVLREARLQMEAVRIELGSITWTPGTPYTTALKDYVDAAQACRRISPHDPGVHLLAVDLWCGVWQFFGYGSGGDVGCACLPLVAHDVAKAILTRSNQMAVCDRRPTPISPAEPPYDNLLQCAAVIPILKHCLWSVLQQPDGAESRLRLQNNVRDVAARLARLSFTDHGHQLIRGGLVASLEAIDEILQAAAYANQATAGGANRAAWRNKGGGPAALDVTTS